MPNKPLLTPAQISEKFLNPKNKFCAMERRAIEDVRADLVEYIETYAESKKAAANANMIRVPPITANEAGNYCTIPEMPY